MRFRRSQILFLQSLLIFNNSKHGINVVGFGVVMPPRRHTEQNQLLLSSQHYQHRHGGGGGSRRQHPTQLYVQERFANLNPTKLNDKERSFIKESLLQNMIFTKLMDDDSIIIDEFVSKFEKIVYINEPGKSIVRQGDICSDDESGCYVYLVGENTQLTVRVNGKVVPEPYGTLTEGTMFGDMAVLYNTPRAATVTIPSYTTSGTTTTTATTILYRVPGDIYKKVVEMEEKYELQKLQEIDSVINQVSGSTTIYDCENIIPSYKPDRYVTHNKKCIHSMKSRLWLWRQWSGTILKVSYPITLLNMVLCIAFILYAQYHNHDSLPTNIVDPTKTILESSSSSSFLSPLLLGLGGGSDANLPDMNIPFNQRLSLLKDIWKYQRDLTTFILTFFVNQAYNFWKLIYDEARNVQGRLDDFMLVAVSNVQRRDDDDDDEDNNNNTGSLLTEESELLLDDIGRYSRLFHVLFWASIAKRFDCLSTQEGLERMASRDMMTAKELDVLLSLNVPGNRKDSIVLEWMMIRANRAISKGYLASDNATKTNLLQALTKLRSSCTAIENKLDGRMPLAYVNFVQILVDTFVLMAPYALYTTLGNYSVIAVGVITLFYAGLLNLAKIFLDPLNNEEFCMNSIYMDLGVLIREHNRNSIKWKDAAKKVPF